MPAFLRAPRRPAAGPVHAALVVMTLTLACATNPATGQRELSLVGEGQEIAMGQEGAKAAAQQMGIYADQALQRYIASLGARVAAVGERPSLPWSFSVVDDPIVNAFALPGGPIFLSRGILTHMNSEAQLVSVLGHEVGHVTAKHSVNQISKQQLLGGLLTVGMVVRPELQQFGGLASQGLGILFLKYGRDDETQADELGFRYMTRLGYDPKEMAEMFRTLERTGGGSDASGPPEWLSTHPDPGNRVERTMERITAAQGTIANATKVDREAFLRAIDGIVFGEDPRAGYFRQTAFIHPTLRFRFVFPTGWRTRNMPQVVVGASSQGDAQIALELAGNTAPQQALSQFLGQQGVRTVGTNTQAINGLPAAVGQFLAQTQDGQVLAGYAAFIQHGGTTYRLLALTPQQSINSYDAVFRGTINSFQPVTDSRLLNVKPTRLRLVQLSRAMTLTQFNQQYPSTIPMAQLALINAVESGATIPAGTLVKRVVAE